MARRPYEFTMVIAGVDLLSAEVGDALEHCGGGAYEGMDCWTEGAEQFAAFAAEAASYDEAVAAVETELTDAVPGLRVVRVDAGARRPLF